MPDEVATWADTVVVGEAYRTWPRIIEDFTNERLLPRYVDVEWAPLGDLAPISDRVIRQVNEHQYITELAWSRFSQFG
jgi:hypothetical protein